MAVGDLSLLVSVPAGAFDSGTILIAEGEAAFTEGAHDALSVGDLLALVTPVPRELAVIRPGHAGSTPSGHVLTTRAGRATVPAAGRASHATLT